MSSCGTGLGAGAGSLASTGVVLVNYRSMDDIGRVLRSGALDLVGTVVVVDNGSDPQDVDDLCRERGAVPVILPVNAGFAAGVNAGVSALGSAFDRVLLLNPDVGVTGALLERLTQALDQRACDGVAPLLVEPSGRLQVGAGGGPLTLKSFIAYFLFVSRALPVRGLMLTRRQSLRPQEVAWLSMACLLLRRTAFDTFGPVPTDELVYAEDVAWGTAASSLGARFWLCSDLRVVHAHGSSGASRAWVGALERLARRRMTPVSAAIAVASMRAGLAARRFAGRSVDQASNTRSTGLHEPRP